MTVAGERPKPDWDVLRGEMMLDPTIINLNTGSFGPLPKCVFEEVTEYRHWLAAEPTHFFVRQVPPLLWTARERLAGFLGTIPERLVFTSNVSAAINLVASGLMIHSPGEILLSDHEYGAMHWCWERVAQQRGLSLKTFALPKYPKEPGEIVEAAAKAMSSRTRLLFFSHVLSPLGMVLPARELCAEARKRGIVSVIDGAHAPAMIPLNVSDVAADFYTGNCHKWLLAASGTGFLVIGPGNEDRLQPLHVSWGYRPDQYPLGEQSAGKRNPDGRDDFGSTARTRFLEFEGTRDICPWLATPKAIDFQTAIGWEAIRGRMRELSQYARQRLGELNLREATPSHPQMSGSLTAFELPLQGPKQAQALRQAIWKHRIEIPVIERPDRMLIRVSTHFYDTTGEIDALVKILPAAIAEAKTA
ncbi:aminotransferase class V-fold PLP-dependent enzyme [Zavarzinella formosa]|uniref:aminotransferase class V-fold PLP-dependent enzyme n=1 Tax=Zavarzinella formosa TaxID=360055 RepID=UPI0003118608|nr:aminotransferase class V-fold PLP-dependent enzyme [Zavarzinella formosa]